MWFYLFISKKDFLNLISWLRWTWSFSWILATRREKQIVVYYMDEYEVWTVSGRGDSCHNEFNRFADCGKTINLLLIISRHAQSHFIDGTTILTVLLKLSGEVGHCWIPKCYVTHHTSGNVDNYNTSSNWNMENIAVLQPVIRRRQRRVACTCPNCLEAKKGNGENKKKQHCCHFPGCNKVYGKTCHLRAHIRWHTDERPYVCNWMSCGRRFTRSDELRRHWRTHTGEKRFQCMECSKSFMRSDHLSKHAKTHQHRKSADVGTMSPVSSALVGKNYDSVAAVDGMCNELTGHETSIGIDPCDIITMEGYVIEPALEISSDSEHREPVWSHSCASHLQSLTDDNASCSFLEKVSTFTMEWFSSVSEGCWGLITL